MQRWRFTKTVNVASILSRRNAGNALSNQCGEYDGRLVRNVGDTADLELECRSRVSPA